MTTTYDTRDAREQSGAGARTRPAASAGAARGVAGETERSHPVSSAVTCGATPLLYSVPPRGAPGPTARPTLWCPPGAERHALRRRAEEDVVERGARTRGRSVLHDELPPCEIEHLPRRDPPHALRDVAKRGELARHCRQVRDLRAAVGVCGHTSELLGSSKQGPSATAAISFTFHFDFFLFEIVF